jgi:carbon-monoxide dehydrogenase medium subunit
VKPAPFEYVRARTLDEALAALDADSKILAGGQSLVPMLNMRLVRPARLVDINAVPGLDGVRAHPDFGGAAVKRTAPSPTRMLNKKLVYAAMVR